MNMLLIIALVFVTYLLVKIDRLYKINLEVMVERQHALTLTKTSLAALQVTTMSCVNSIYDNNPMTRAIVHKTLTGVAYKLGRLAE